MSTGHGLLFLLLLGYGSSKQNTAPTASSCLPPATADSGTKLTAVDNGKTIAC